jgi:glycosyltransferase involved in cell wall biosynthesis
MKLSILIPTVPQREVMFVELINYLYKQCAELLNTEVEILTDASPVGSMTTGEKRNKLLNEAKGDYVWFIDDDDWVSETAIEDILEGIKTYPDSFAINGTFTENGKNFHKWYISKDLEYCADIIDGEEVYLRPPNHITPMKRSIAIHIGFPLKSNQEDYDFCMRLKNSKLIKTEYKIEKPIYDYRYLNYNKLY